MICNSAIICLSCQSWLNPHHTETICRDKFFIIIWCWEQRWCTILYDL